ncbi:unnamed protein product [Pieris brassicae]|uniref:Uncharacterized protein n=1 Tax=Pieris brassicae TaxID=7116 RepID=A0A9P0TIJ5_PIEBR|nr:unnamed protein product [Pieris brassicae]
MNSKRSIQPKYNMNRCPIHILLPILTIILPYISTLNLPSGDPAPGRSPGPPFSEIEDYDETTTSEVTTVQVITDACEYARISSESEQIVTLSETESDVKLTVSHPVFDTAELVRGVVYDGKFFL